MTPPSDSIEARIAALHEFVSVPHDEWSSSFWHSQLDDALEVIDALADRVREAEREWIAIGEQHDETLRRAYAAEAEVKALRNKLNTDSQNFELECRKAQLKALRAALRKFGVHKIGCSVLAPPYIGRELAGSICTCGFRAALAASESS